MKKALLTSLLCSLLAPIPSLGQRFHAAALPAAHCGVERWPVKTLTDPAGESIAATSPTLGTIATLVAATPPTRKELLGAASSRFAQEKVVYRVPALVMGDKQEGDSDFHIVLAAPSDPRTTLIGEIPSGGCVAAKRAAFFTGLRAQFAKDFGKPAQGKLRRLAQPVTACVTGVGFFDFLHGQDGVAPNGFELHPVLSIVKGACT
jgi:hypothetical protein